ncbi:MAG: hypothetical protein IT233_09950 [Bacteroidia bacterium]|nr:hypothetical protein [Bacteroidia bacterium]
MPGRILILLVFLTNALSAQQDSSLKHEIEFRSDAFFNSDAITGRFFHAFYLGNYLDSALKSKVRDRTRYISRWGADLSYGIQWNYSPDSLFGKTGIHLQAGLFDRMHANGIFSHDLFHLAFFGNADKAGETLDLGNFRLNMLLYQQLQFGISWEADSTRRGHGFAISLLKGEQNYQLDVKQADLYTAPDGTFIDLSTRMESHQTDTAHRGPGAFNGFGVSADMYWEFPYVTWFHGGVLSVDLNDFGFIAWNKRSLHHRLDTFLHFEGVQVDNLFDLQEGTFPQMNADSVWKNNMNYSTGSYLTFLPAILSIRATTYYGKKFIVEKGINYRFMANARPFYYGSFGWNITRDVFTALNVSYGGYGRLNAGMEAEVKFAKRFKLNVQSYYLTGLALPDITGGLGAAFTAGIRF